VPQLPLAYFISPAEAAPILYTPQRRWAVHVGGLIRSPHSLPLVLFPLGPLVPSFPYPLRSSSHSRVVGVIICQRSWLDRCRWSPLHPSCSPLALLAVPRPTHIMVAFPAAFALAFACGGRRRLPARQPCQRLF
jgi:hypothetical protein